ncbi:MAG TPA: hypothetical protein VJC18_02520, partial [bacterium]|nr:hypothetical protein [bacterium]
YAQTEVHTEQGGASFEEVRGRIFKTIDGGENWSLVWDGNALTRYLIIDPENTDTLYVSTGIFDREAYDSDCANDIQGGVGVLKSTDGGQTWAQSNNGLNDLFVGSLRMHPTNHNILFAATGSISCSGAGHMGLYKTTNGGTSWTQVIDDAILTTVNFSLSNPSTMYAGGYGGFFKSTDGGTTWTEYTRGSLKTWGPEGVNGGFPIDVTVHPDDPDLVYVNAYGGGVLRSTDGTQTWELWSNGFSGAILYDVEVPSYDSSTVYAIGRSGPFKSTDYGETWTGIANYDHIANEWMTVATHPDNPDLVFISIEGESIVYRSDDGGTSFEQIIADDEPESGIKSFAFAPSDPEVIYGCVAKADLYPSESYQNIAHGKGLYKSTDGGQYFSLIDTNLTDVNWRRIVVDPDDADTAYAATSSGLYKTTDGGTHWTRFAGLGDKFLADVIIDFDNDYFVVSEMFGGVYVSDDAGVTWTGPNNTGMNSGNPYVAALVFDPEDIDIIYAAETYSGVYQSTDQGLTWSPFPDDDMSGLDYHAVKDIVITDAALYVATQGAGVFRYVRE